MTYESWYISYLTKKLEIWWTVAYVAKAITKTSWRILIKKWNTKEWFKFTWTEEAWTKLTWLVRQLSTTSDPITSLGDWFEWSAWTQVILVSMHDQLIDKNIDIDFDSSVQFSKSIQVPVFDDATERDTIITSPDNWMLCYITDVQDYYSYKNWIWVKGLWWSWWAVTWYQDSTDDWTLVWDIDWVNVTYELSHTPAQPQWVILTYNWQVLEYWASDDYTISWTTITMNFAPISWKLVAFYPDVPTGTNNAETRVTSSVDAHNWELFRNSWDSENLYYKTDLWDVIKIIDNTTEKIVWDNIDFTWVDLSLADTATETLPWVIELATDIEATTWTDTTRAMTPKTTRDNYSFVKMTASNNQQVISATQASLPYNVSYQASTKQIRIAYEWTIRVKYEMASSISWQNVNWQLAKNWTDYYSNNSTNLTTFTQYTDNVPVKSCDIITIYWRWNSSWANALYKNMSVSFDKKLYTNWCFIDW